MAGISRLQIEIVNALGIPVQQAEVSAGDVLTLDTQAFPAGVYHVRACSVQRDGSYGMEYTTNSFVIRR